METVYLEFVVIGLKGERTIFNLHRYMIVLLDFPWMLDL